MATEKLYIVKLASGEELGPMDQDALVKLAEEGTITSKAQIRSKLIPDWNKAGSVDFLKAIIFQQQQEEMAAQAKNKPLYQKLYERITLQAPQPEQRGRLINVKLDTLPPPSSLARILAGLVDLVIILMVSAGLLAIGKDCLARECLLNDHHAVYVTVAAILTFVLMYYALFMGVFTQTPGQRFWGFFLIRLNAKPFWMCRAFLYGLLLIPFGLVAPIFFLLKVKTYPELLTRTRFAKAIARKKR